jgi:hypothetical protein
VVTAVMAGLSLMCAFPLAVTTLFVYAGYARMNAPYDPLMFVVVWGTILWLGLPLARRVIGKRSLAAVRMSVREDRRRAANAAPVASPLMAPEASAGDMERVPTGNADIAGS